MPDHTLPGRRTLVRAGAMLLAAPLVGLAARPALAANSSWQSILDRGTVRIGVLQSHAPYHDLQGGKWVGFAIQMGLDCMAAVSEAMKKPLRAEYVETSLANVILDLQADKLDLYFGLTASAERRRAVSLFGPIYELPECAINARGFNPGDKWEDYNHPSISVAVVMGSTDEQAAQKKLPKADIRSLKSTAEAILDIQSGNSKVMINTLLSGMQARKQTPNLAAPIVLQPVFSQPSTGGTRKDGDGRFAAFLDEWVKGYRSSGRSKQVIMEALQQAGLDTANLPSTLQL